jgi:CRP/FNR family cyclic AMP-dependent transcriptional regulator
MFDGLTPNELLSATDFFKASKCAPDASICRYGDPSTCMCIIRSGAVSVRQINSNCKIIELSQLRKGRAFGEMAVLNGERRSASCIAVSQCSLLMLARGSLDKQQL